MPVSETLKELSSIFNSNGFSLYLVGGAVRDYLLGKPNHDYDFTTDATPEEVKKMVRRTIDTGIKHGTVTVLFKGESFEITTFRTEGDYSDGRHPDSVCFVRSLEEDLKRRDFTINAMAADLTSGEIIDLHGGIEDLKNGVIRAIGIPEERFREDALRMMRAARFSSKLGFDIEENTQKAMSALSANITLVSKERIREEFFRLIDSPHPRKGIETMMDSGLMDILFPEISRCGEIEGDGYHKENLLEHLILALEYARDNNYPLLVKISALLHDIGKPETARKDGERTTFFSHEIVGERMARVIMERLKSSNDERDMVSLLVREHMIQYSPSWTDGAVRRLIVRVGKNNLDYLFMVREADRKATLGLPEDFDDESLKERVRREIEKDSALTLKDLAVNGKDIMAMGKNGKDVGRILNSLLDAVLDTPELNTRDSLLDLAKTI